MKNFIWIGGAVIILVLLMFWGVKGSVDIEPSFEAGILHPLDNVKGNVESKVVVMEYSDFQCPACRTYYSVTKELIAEFEDRVTFVYRHFPLTNIHFNAELAARVAEAAGKQDKFWEMHDLLFEKQDEWSRATDIESVFGSYATLLGLSVPQFQTDLKSKEVKNFVKAQKTHSIKIGLRGTPTFFVNGEEIQNPTSVKAFKSIIREALKEQ